MYKQKARRPARTEYDLVIIGGGIAGSVAANLAVGAGKKVALVEAETLGGSAQNLTSLPLLALRESARRFRMTHNSLHYGVHTGNVSLHFGSAQVWRNSLVGRHQDIYKLEQKNSGVHHYSGRAHFLDKFTISIGDRRLSAKRFIIATGSRPAIPAIPGLAASGFLTYQDLAGLSIPPKSVIIIGGGHTGLEVAQLLSDFGSEVTILEKESRLLHTEDADVDRFMRQRFLEEGIKVVTGADIQLVNKSADHKTVRFTAHGGAHSLSAEEVLVACGNRPNVDLGLDNAGVKYKLSGVVVNSQLRSSQKHIYAIGDVNSLKQTSASAAYQARLAVYNLTHRKNHAANLRFAPRVVYSLPEIASVGMTKPQLLESGQPFQSAGTMLDILTRAAVQTDHPGFVKVYASPSGQLLGGVVVAPNASEIIHELALAVSRGLKADAVSDITHALPTWSEGIAVACAKIHCR